MGDVMISVFLKLIRFFIPPRGEVEGHTSIWGCVKESRPQKYVAWLDGGEMLVVSSKEITKLLKSRSVKKFAIYHG